MRPRPAGSPTPGLRPPACRSNDDVCQFWSDRAAFTGKPALLLWGLKDIAFRRNDRQASKRCERTVSLPVFFA